MDTESSEHIPQIYDSLPYYDHELEQDPLLAEKVNHEIAVELQRLPQQPFHPNAPPDIELFAVSSAPTHLFSITGLQTIADSMITG